jgi:hypothetical protein
MGVSLVVALRKVLVFLLRSGLNEREVVLVQEDRAHRMNATFKSIKMSMPQKPLSVFFSVGVLQISVQLSHPGWPRMKELRLKRRFNLKRASG